LAEVVGRGRRSEILAWGEGRVLKLYCSGWPRSTFEDEVKATAWLHEHGLPVPAVHGTLELDGRLGIIMERVSGPTVSDVAKADPERLPELATMMAEIQACLHAVRAPAGAARLRDRLVRKILSPRCPLTPEKKDGIVQAVGSMPDGDSLCHGDFHGQNIILPPGRPPVVIDWDAPAGGNPLADVGRTVLLIRAMSCYAQAGHPGGPSFLAAVAGAVDVYLDRYFELRREPRADLEKWVWINAAARLCEGIDEEEAWLIGLVDLGLAIP
jgi:aminoglycoside phosphotransferase (APT) family kinase protein